MPHHIQSERFRYIHTAKKIIIIIIIIYMFFQLYFVHMKQKDQAQLEIRRRIVIPNNSNVGIQEGSENFIEGLRKSAVIKSYGLYM